MGTKGYYAVVFNGKIYVFSSRTDSYPDGLGQVLLDEIRNCNMEEWKNLITNSIVIQNEDDHNRFFPTSMVSIQNEYEVGSSKKSSISKIEMRRQIMNNLKNSYAYKIFYRNIDIEQSIETFTYNDYCRLYDYSYSLDNILKTQFLYTIYHGNKDNFKNVVNDIEYKYDCSYGYIINLDINEFIFDNLQNYQTHIFSFSKLPKNLSEYCEK